MEGALTLASCSLIYFSPISCPVSTAERVFPRPISVAQKKSTEISLVHFFVCARKFMKVLQIHTSPAACLLTQILPTEQTSAHPLYRQRTKNLLCFSPENHLPQTPGPRKTGIFLWEPEAIFLSCITSVRPSPPHFLSSFRTDFVVVERGWVVQCDSNAARTTNDFQICPNI